LDDLAGIVASSGLTSGRLQKKTPPPPIPREPATPWDRRTVILLASAGGVIALLLIVILILAFRDRSGGTVASTDQGTGQTVASSGGSPSVPPSPPAATVAPNFLGQTIDAATVAYVLDRGGYSHESRRLDLLKSALLSSVKSLGPNRRFQVVFWEIANEQPLAYPIEGTRPATVESINDLRAFLDQVYSVGSTEEVTALHVALKSKPQAVMFVPIRGLAEEQQALATRVLRERAGENAQGTKFYCFTLGQTEWAPAMRQISDSTGGAYRDVPVDELNKFANP
jgi:hypothetical protein